MSPSTTMRTGPSLWVRFPAPAVLRMGPSSKWDALNTWSIDDGSSTWTIEADCVDPAVLGNHTTYTFCFHFKPGEVAKESVHDTGGDAEWMIYAKATDLGGPSTADNHQETLEMNWYGKISWQSMAVVPSLSAS